MSITREVAVQPTVHELATEFADLGSIEQAEFFQRVAVEFRTWGAYARDHQVLAIARNIGDASAAYEFICMLADAIRKENA